MLGQFLKCSEGYLIGRYSLQDLETWLLSNLQGILDSGDQTTIKLANQLDADFVELSEDMIDEVTFRKRLDGYIRLKETMSVIFSGIDHASAVHGSTTAETINDRLEVPGQVVDHRLAHVVFG